MITVIALAIVCLFIWIYKTFENIHGDVAALKQYSPETSVSPFANFVYIHMESIKK